MKKRLSFVLVSALVLGLLMVLSMEASADTWYNLMFSDSVKPGDFFKAEPKDECDEIIEGISASLTTRDNKTYAHVSVYTEKNISPVKTLDIILYGDHFALGQYGVVVTTKDCSTNGIITNYADGVHAAFLFDEPIVGRFEIYVSLKDNGRETLPTALVELINGSGYIGFGNTGYWNYAKFDEENEKSVLSLVTVDDEWRLKGKKLNLSINDYPMLNSSISSRHIVKSDDSLWDTFNNKKVMDGVRAVLPDYRKNSYVIKTDDSLWQLAFIENGYHTPDIKWPDYKWMDNVRYITHAYTNLGYEGLYVIKNDNSLWLCGQWTAHPAGVLIDRAPPKKIMDDVQAIWTLRDGLNTTFILKIDGSLWGWGENKSGELGDGTKEVRTRDNPKKIMDNVVTIALSLGSSDTTNPVKLPATITIYMLKSDGSLWGCGNNDLYQLGTGNKAESLTPVKIMDEVVAVDAGNRHASVIKSDGTVLSWGLKLGTDELVKKDEWFVVNYEANLEPVIIAYSVKSVFCGFYFACCIKEDKSLWYWGRGTQKTLTPIKLLDNVVFFHQESTTRFAILADGSLWRWGITDFLEYYDPIKIMDGVKLPGVAVAPPKPAITAAPTASTVLINGKPVSFDAYNISGNNYFKLRDIAFALNGSEKNFEVGWDATANAITLTSGKPYTKIGGEMAGKGSGNQQVKPTTAKIYLDGKEVQLTAYNIGDNNYFKLRDLGQAFDFGVEWDGNKNTISIDTSKGYIVE